MAASSFTQVTPVIHSQSEVNKFQNLDLLGLPHVMALNIYKYFDYQTIVKTQTVSRSFRDQTNDPVFWRIKIEGNDVVLTSENDCKKAYKKLKIEKFIRNMPNSEILSIAEEDQAIGIRVNFEKYVNSLSPEQLGNALILCIDFRVMSLVRFILNSPKSDHLLLEESGLGSALIRAVISGNLEAVKLIMASQKFPQIPLEPTGFSISEALDCAAVNNQFAVIQLMSEMFAKLSPKRASLILETAAKKGHVEIMEFLIGTPKFDQMTIKDLTKVAIAAFASGNIHAVRSIMLCKRFPQISKGLEVLSFGIQNERP